MRSKQECHNIRALRTSRRRSGVFLAILIGAVLCETLLSQEVDDDKFTNSSLQYRTALHYDPLLPLPLESLVKLYSEVNREDELIGLYRSHVEQYPDDAGAKTVLIRLLQRFKRPGAGELISTAVPRHPNFAPLQYLLHQFLRGKGDVRAVDALSKAIDLETNSARRSEWLEELLQLSEGVEAREAASRQLGSLLEVEGQTGPNLLALAQLMQRYEFWELSGEALAKIPPGSLDPEGSVERSVLRARAELQTGKASAAAAILDSLLGKLAADHWRRREVMSLRFSVVASPEQRGELIAKYREAFEKNPASEVALLDYIDLLIASELQTKASDLLIEYADRLPQTSLVERTALSLLDSLNDPSVMERFLSARLELDPERPDLRFRMVKSLYALERDADAAQEFQVVIAGTGAEEESERVLELQRYLRSIDRTEAAEVYLERYVNSNPGQLSVARELGEVYVTLDRLEEIEDLISGLDVAGTPVEDVLDLADFLSRNEFLVQAKRILSSYFSSDGENFEVGLLLIEVLGELGDSQNGGRLISRMRELADSPERYSQWLEAAVNANADFESVDRFFEIERNRFSFEDGKWPGDKVEKFVMLCEMGKQRNLAGRVTEMVRAQLEEGAFDADLRIRLRQFLVGVLQSDTAALPEVEDQLSRLIEEDPALETRYELQLALAYHRASRIDLAQDLLLGIDLADVNEADLVQEAVEVLLSYGFLAEAERALAAVNRLAPSDLFAWERRLTILALLKQENEFRSLIRQLRNGEVGKDLRPESIIALDQHMVSSHWRSVSRLFASGNAQRFEEILPLLASAEREARSPESTAWTEWSRAIVLQALGREEEVTASMERLEALLERLKLEQITFPDGLVLSRHGARRFLARNREVPELAPGSGSDFLFAGAETGWAYEAEKGSRIVRFGKSGEFILVLDHRGLLSALDLQTGKVTWSTLVPDRESDYDEINTGARPSLFFDLPGSHTAFERRGTAPPRVKMPRNWLIDDEKVALLTESRLLALSTQSGETLWSAPLVFSTESDASNTPYSRAGIRIERDEERAYVFHPDSGEVFAIQWATGKLLWESRIGGESRDGDMGVHSLNAGMNASDGLLFLYGRESAILDGATGRPLWFFGDRIPLTFPVILRKQRTPAAGQDISPGDGEQASPAGGAEGPQSWKSAGNALGASERLLRFVDFLRVVEPSHGSDLITREEAALVGPASFWAVTRTTESDAAMGVLSDGFLWLMNGGVVRRVSTRFPVASRSLPGEGVYLGQQGSHAWFLEDRTLRHLDFYRDQSEVVSFEQIGAGPLRASFLGNQLVIRGEKGIRAVNTRTGNVIGTMMFPERIMRFLAEREPVPVAGSVEYYWQGMVREVTDGRPSYLWRVVDILDGNSYVTQFGDSILVCLVRAEDKQVASSMTNSSED